MWSSCAKGKSMPDDGPTVSIDYEIQGTDGSFMSTRTIETPEDADKLLGDYLPLILPVIYVTICVNNETNYRYVLDPKDYTVQMLHQMKKDMLCDMKRRLQRLQQFLEDEG